MPVDDFSEKIELLVNDENRIVTYKILSQELKVHANKAKQCLMDFYNAQKLKGINLQVHYFLAGFTERDGIRTVKVIVVSEDKLENAKTDFSELTSFHIYSVYKGVAKDECGLYSADYTYIKDKEEQNKYSAIKHPNIEIQPPVLNKIKVNNDPKINIAKKCPPAASSSGNASIFSKSEQKLNVANNSTPEKRECSKEPAKDSNENKITSEDKKQKSGTLMSMWQKKEEKVNGTKKEISKPENKGKEAVRAVAKYSIMNMFSKQAAKNSEKPPAPKSSTSKEEESSKMVVSDVSPREETSKSMKSKENKKTSQKRKSLNKNSKESSKSKKDSDSENEFEHKSKKKRRRICTFDDSDSESELEEERDKAQRNLFLPEDPMDTVENTPLTEDEEPIPPTPPVIHVKGRVKMWKTVQKTYQDEDGFLITKTEKELVSASEDEEEPVTAKKEEIVNKKSIAVNKKQASLMSFFKQK